MREIGAAALPIIPTFDGVKSNLERGLSGPLSQSGSRAGRAFGDNAGKSLTSSLSAHAKKAAALAAGAFATGQLFNYGKDAVNLAADLEQSIGAVDTVFKGSANQIHDWAKNAAVDVGLTRNEFNELGSLIGTQLKNGGTAMSRLAPKTNQLIKLGADLSSMFGGSTREAIEALSSALKGERDPIERYGVSINEAAIKAEALSSGIVKARVDSFELHQATLKMTIAQDNFNKAIAKHGKDSIEAAKAEATLGAATKKFNTVSEGKVEQLTAQQKQAATLSLIYKQTADAQGNFAKETDTLSHKQQVLKARLENTKTEIGTALLPIVSDAADVLLKTGVPAFEKFADWFSSEGIPALRGFGREIRPLAEELIPAAGSALGIIADGLETAAPLAKALVGSFNDMPEWAKAAFVAGGVTLGVKSKLGKNGGRPGGPPGGGKGETLADPVYVWVVNGGTPGTPGKAPKSGPAAFLGSAKGNLAAAAVYLGLDNTLDNLKKGFEGKRGFVDGITRSLIPGIHTAEVAADKAGKAMETLGLKLDKAGVVARDRAQYERLYGKKLDELAALTANDKPGDSWAAMFGGDRKLGEIIKEIPPGKLKILQDPATIKTQADAKKLLGDVDTLSRKDFKLLFRALGLEKAKDDAAELLKNLRLIAGEQAALGGSSGLNPFAGRRSSVDRITSTSSAPVQINNLHVNGTTTDRLVNELSEIRRRAAIGGY